MCVLSEMIAAIGVISSSTISFFQKKWAFKILFPLANCSDTAKVQPRCVSSLTLSVPYIFLLRRNKELQSQVLDQLLAAL